MAGQNIVRFVIRVPKEHSSFIYFTFEASEGLSFYSTIIHQEGDLHRDIEIFCTPEFVADVEHTFEVLGKKFALEILSRENK